MGDLDWNRCYRNRAKPVYDEEERERREIEACMRFEQSWDRLCEQRANGRKGTRRRKKESELSRKEQFRLEILRGGRADTID